MLRAATVLQWGDKSFATGERLADGGAFETRNCACVEFLTARLILLKALQQYQIDLNIVNFGKYDR